jgi:ABC-2 type transport system ATP-binding protein
MLEVEKLNKTYPCSGPNRRSRTGREAFSLKDISFTLPGGCILGFIGVNGAGKTTTLKSILNIAKPDSGTVRFLGQNFYEHEALLKQKIGFMLGPADYYQKTKTGKVADVYRRFFTEWDGNVFNSYLCRFGIDAEKKIGELSAGAKVKFALALALSHNAKLFILDEPTGGLDPVARDELLGLFREIASSPGRSILFSTHITADLDKCADRIIFIKNGELIACDSREGLLEKHRLLTGKDASLEDIMLYHHREAAGT